MWSSLPTLQKNFSTSLSSRSELRTKLFASLWDGYCRLTPQALKISRLFEQQRGERIKNDHVAFRTIDHPLVGVESLARHFVEDLGYMECEEYFFPQKKLRAKHYECKEDASAPKVFISELLLENFTRPLQETMNELVEHVEEQDVKNGSILMKGSSIWQPLEMVKYQRLLEETEYAAWLYTFGYCANHFTVDVNALTTFKSLEEVNAFVMSNGMKMNTSGGLIKGSEQDLLKQSSTIADCIAVPFKEGTAQIPSCYYEFAYRYPHPTTSRLFSGFVAESADKIFESTNTQK